MTIQLSLFEGFREAFAMKDEYGEAIGRRMAYDRYMGSARWRNIRKDYLNSVEHRCERCGCRSFHQLEVHHLSYCNFGKENFSDLKAVCVPCHRKEDAERRAKLAIQFQEEGLIRRYLTARDTYFEKVHGSVRFVPLFAYDEFDGWIVRKNPDFAGVWNSDRFDDVEGERISWPEGRE